MLVFPGLRSSETFRSILLFGKTLPVLINSCFVICCIIIFTKGLVLLLIKLFYGPSEIGIYDTVTRRCIFEENIESGLAEKISENTRYLNALFEYGMPEGSHLQLYKNQYFEEIKRGKFPWLSESSNFSTAEPGSVGYVPVSGDLPSGVVVKTDIAPDLFVSENAGKRGVLPSFSGYKDKFPGRLERISGVYTVTMLDKHSGSGNIIVKPQSSKYPCICENEFIFMQLAVRAGVPVPRTWLCLDSVGKLHYCVERFGIYKDSEGRIYKENMVDFLGAMNVRSKDKYTVSIEDLFTAAEKFLTPYDLNVFSRMWYYGFLIGNTDMHPKNFSMFIRDGEKWKLAPAYDMVHMPCYGIEGTSCLKKRGKGLSPSRREIESFILGYLTSHETGEIKNAVYANAVPIINNVFRISLNQNHNNIVPAEHIKNSMINYFSQI